MTLANFIHLKTHSAYSLAEGAIRLKDLAPLCAAYQMPAVGITDTGNLFGALEISETLAKAGVQPIIGCTLAVDFPELEDTENTGLTSNKQTAIKEFTRIALFAQSHAGYLNLMELVSKSFLETDGVQLPHVSAADLEKCAEDVILLTGGPDGPINRLISEDKPGRAQALTRRLAKHFGNRLYVELQRHGLPEEEKAEPGLIDIAYDLGLPLVATNEAYFPDQDMFEAHDALLCVAEGTYVMEENRRSVTQEHYFKSAKEMTALFADLPEAIENTIEIAKRCHFRPKTRPPILPKFGADASGAPDVEIDEAEELRRQSTEGLKVLLEKNELYAEEKVYWDRLEYELGIINTMDFPGYFLIVSDFMKWTRAQNIPVGVRGSGAASVVAWALAITNLDPLRFDLLFERFLNPERISMPDFDIDFCQERRHEVIEYVQDKYGHDKVAQIITYGKMQARMVVRDVGRVLQMPYGQVDRLCRLIPNNPAKPTPLHQAIKEEHRLREAGEEEEIVGRMLDIGVKLEGLYRNASTHAAGVVIADRPLHELVPVYRDPRSDMPVTQYSMKWVEPAGLVKFDFLGLKTLTVIARTENFLKDRGIEIKTDQVTFDNVAVYEMLSKGDSVGVFQLESSGMQDLLRKMKPDRIEDLIALVALYRPGPMDSIPTYIACKHGRQEVKYLHPLLEPLLNETFGVMTYQEDVMQIAQHLAGYSLGEADLLRRAMGKKIASEMDKHRDKFIDGAEERGIDRPIAEQIFETAAKFAGYGFNKAHAAAYAQVAYQTAYLKANYPVEFVASLMSLDLGNTDKLAIIKQEAHRLEIKIVPPDINRSKADFSIDNGEVLYALAAVKNVGRQAMEHIVEEREASGEFTDLFDFAHRVDPKLINRRTLENLAKAGAFDQLNPNRAQVVAAADMLSSVASRAADERASNQDSLFGGGDIEIANPPMPDVDEWYPMEMLSHELDAVGFYLSGHPLDGYRKALRQVKVEEYASILANPKKNERVLNIAGSVIIKQERKSQRGQPYAFITLTDPTGQFEVMVFSDVLNASREMLEPGKSVVLRVEAKWESSDDGDDQLRLFARSVKSLEDVTSNAGGVLRVFLEEPEPLSGLRDRLDRYANDNGAGKGTVRLVLMVDDGMREIEVDLPGGYKIDPALMGAVKSLGGVIDVEEL